MSLDQVEHEQPVWLVGSVVGPGRLGVKQPPHPEIDTLNLDFAVEPGCIDAGTEIETSSFLNFMLYLLINTSN
jgi:hypothetical protein